MARVLGATVGGSFMLDALERRLLFSSIQGRVFEDLDANDKLNSGEAGINAWTVLLVKGGEILRQKETAVGDLDDGKKRALSESGFYRFGGLGTGNYTVVIVDHENWVEGDSVQFALSTKQARKGVNFAVRPTFGYDYGDAPNSYHTRRASNGPRHALSDDVPAPFIGSVASVPDKESNGKPGPKANGDDTSGRDEETFPKPSLVRGESASVEFQVVQNDASESYLTAWVDWDGNGTFSKKELAFSRTLPRSLNPIDELIVTTAFEGFDAPADAVVGKTFMRLRISSIAPVLDPVGPWIDGEVEDFAVRIADNETDGSNQLFTTSFDNQQNGDEASERVDQESEECLEDLLYE